MYMYIKNIFIWSQRRSNVLPNRHGRQTELQQCNTAFFYLVFFFWRGLPLPKNSNLTPKNQWGLHVHYCNKTFFSKLARKMHANWEKNPENKVFLYHQTSISYISGKGILCYSKNVGRWLHVYINMEKKVHAEKSHTAMLIIINDYSTSGYNDNSLKKCEF